MTRNSDIPNPNYISDDCLQLIQRLSMLTAELTSNPSREAVSDLVELATEMNCFGDKLPRRAGNAIDHFMKRRRELISLLEEFAARAEFRWLVALIAKIDARWEIALRECGEPEQIDELANDVVAAIERSRVAAKEYVQVSATIEANRLAKQAAEQAQTNDDMDFIAQRLAIRRYSEALRQTLADEEEQLAKQEKLIDVASPFETSFDYSRDYAAELNDSASADTTASTQTTTVKQLPSKGHTDHYCPQFFMDIEQADVGQAVPEPATQLLGEEANSVVPAQEQAESIDARNERQELANETQASGIYTDETGEICRPIWDFLSNKQAALAFHTASWIKRCRPEVRVPPPDLLAAISLAEELKRSDGAIQTELDARLKKLASEDFTAHSPRDWYAALNLLLVAATLRPMALAPNTCAASVATYLHLDGRYSALYELIQKLRKLSEKLTGFPIDPIALYRARNEADLKDEFSKLQSDTEDWLKVQAPSYTIKFEPATKVWRYWVREGGKVNALVSPIVHNQKEKAERVRDMLNEMSNPDYISRLVHETDRKDLKRKRGEEIQAGALSHLQRNVEEALKLSQKWLKLINLLDRSGSDRLRSLLKEVNDLLRRSREAVKQELDRATDDDGWGLIRSGRIQVLHALDGLLDLFGDREDFPEDEWQPNKVLGRSLLCVPDLPVEENWGIADDKEVNPEYILSCLRAGVIPAKEALQKRLDRGDILGAEMMIDAKLIDVETIQLRQERDRWKSTFRKEIDKCRRSVQDGLVYGYLSSAERAQFESMLAIQEARIEELRRFDDAMNRVQNIRKQVETARDVRVQTVQDELCKIALTEETQPTVVAVNKALSEGDIATANEFMHWLKQDGTTPFGLDVEERDSFDRFFPEAMRAIETWLEEQRRDAVEKALRQGQSISCLDFSGIAGAQREQSAKMFSDWSDMKSQHEVEELRLKHLLTGLGLTVKELRRIERVSEREIWKLDAEPIKGRDICSLPMYGSLANGRYRIICVWGRPTEDDLLQWVGDSSVNQPALLLYFGRMTERKWRDMSRLAKTKRRSLVMLDETLLIYLCSAKGSRLKVWFDVAMPFSYAFPYDATAGLVPPEMFYGRGEELEAVRGLNGRCFIYGGRQLGKTALLKRAEQSFHLPSQEHYARWIDLRAEGIGVSRTTAEIWVTLYERFKELNVIDAKLSAPVTGKKVIGAIREFLKANSDRRILLLLDEADRFFEQDAQKDFEETRQLKQLMDDTQRRFKVVFAGLHNVLRMTERPNHPLAHFGEPIEIGPLREGQEAREAVDLIRKPMDAAGFAFKPERLPIRILAQTNYYPSLIQLYCSHLLGYMLKPDNLKQQDGPRYTVTDQDIDRVYSSDELRNEIRAKFRLTLQLDPRYEVLAYSMALDLLQNHYQQSEGMHWRTIRDTALQWWAEGFRNTSELDFRVLLDEMVGLGVLSQVPTNRYYVLRNPNVLLLLGTIEEIETVLCGERELAPEFKSESFRPPLRRNKPSSEPEHNVFTYQQLGHLLQRKNNITVVTGTDAAGIARITADLEDYLGNGNAPVAIEGCTDRQLFGKTLQAELAGRPKGQTTIFVVPKDMPWTDLWIREAQDQLERLKSESSFASLVFVADSATLWRLLNDEQPVIGQGDLSWMSLLQWDDGFLRHWLGERKLQLELEDRRSLSEKTGLWSALIMELAGDCDEQRALKEQISTAINMQTVARREQFGLNVAEPTRVLETLVRLGGSMTPNGLSIIADFAGRSQEHVKICLRWGELLGLVRNEGAGNWAVDPVVSRILGENG
jgi:hypothetical protein